MGEPEENKISSQDVTEQYYDLETRIRNAEATEKRFLVHLNNAANKPEDTRAIRGALHRVLTDPTLSDELRNRGLRRAQHFSWERAARETVELYERLAA